jgi:hypothetical protein
MGKVQKTIKIVKHFIKISYGGKKEHNTRLKAKWDDCCAQKKIGRLGLINLEDELSNGIHF